MFFSFFKFSKKEPEIFTVVVFLICYYFHNVRYQLIFIYKDVSGACINNIVLNDKACREHLTLYNDNN